MSRKHWSDLFLLTAVTALILAVVLSNYGRMLAIFATPVCLICGIVARRRMLGKPRAGVAGRQR
jgi:hypothetical protein